MLSAIAQDYLLGLHRQLHRVVPILFAPKLDLPYSSTLVWGLRIASRLQQHISCGFLVRMHAGLDFC